MVCGTEERATVSGFGKTGKRWPTYHQALHRHNCHFKKGPKLTPPMHRMRVDFQFALWNLITESAIQASQIKIQ